MKRAAALPARGSTLDYRARGYFLNTAYWHTNVVGKMAWVQTIRFDKFGQQDFAGVDRSKVTSRHRETRAYLGVGGGKV